MNLSHLCCQQGPLMKHHLIRICKDYHLLSGCWVIHLPPCKSFVKIIFVQLIFSLPMSEFSGFGHNEVRCSRASPWYHICFQISRIINILMADSLLKHTSDMRSFQMWLNGFCHLADWDVNNAFELRVIDLVPDAWCYESHPFFSGVKRWRNYRSSLKWHKKCKIISCHCFHCIGLEIKFRTLSDTAEPWAADWWRVEPGPAPVPGSPSGRYTEHRNSHHSGAHFLDLVCVILPDSNIFWAEIHPTPIIMDKFSAVTEAPFIHQKVTSSDRCI